MIPYTTSKTVAKKIKYLFFREKASIPLKTLFISQEFGKLFDAVKE
jgi:hypothetical protein